MTVPYFPDEANYIYRFVDGKMEIEKQHDNAYRDEQNRLLPEGAPVPSPALKPRTPFYYDPFAYLFLILFIVAPAVITYRLQAKRRSPKR